MVQDSSATLTIQSIVVKEKSPFTFQTYQIDAISLAAWLAAWTNFKAASDAICAGVLRHETVNIYNTLIDASMPVSNFARRETKLLIRYTGDVSGKLFRIEFPCPQLDVLTMETGDANFVNINDAGVMTTWVTEFENLARSPEDPTENVTVQSIQVVGRNI